jgi:hypothetical protein
MDGQEVLHCSTGSFEQNLIVGSMRVKLIRLLGIMGFLWRFLLWDHQQIRISARTHFPRNVPRLSDPRGTNSFAQLTKGPWNVEAIDMPMWDVLARHSCSLRNHDSRTLKMH